MTEETELIKKWKTYDIPHVNIYGMDESISILQRLRQSKGGE